MRKIFIIALAVLLYCTAANAANIFVDGSLGSNCTSGNYSIANRSCTGSAGNAYATIQAAVNAMSAGDHIIIRGGTYTECIALSPSTNPSNGSWTLGNYNKMVSCGTEEGCSTNEWAIIDGDQNCSTGEHQVIGLYSDNVSGSSSLKWWWFERLEITGGGISTNPNGPGIWINGGPWKLRYSYLHDNGKGQPGTCDYASTATQGYGWKDSVIEYNWFADNGSVSTNNNCKQISWDESYPLTDQIWQNGLTINETTGVATSNGTSGITAINNQIRYNYVSGGTVGIAPKHFVLRTGRSTSGSDYSDTYQDYGTKIHHNIVYNANTYAIGAHGDFDQVYNNIVDTAGEAVRVMYDYWSDDNAYGYHYKVSIYNNTFIDTAGIFGLGRRFADWQNGDYYTYIYNNILDTCGEGPTNGYGTAAIVLKYRNSGETRSMTYTNSVVSNNYHYRPYDSYLYQTFASTIYDNTGWGTQSDTGGSKVSYTAAYNAGNLLFDDTTGAGKYTIRPTHTVGGTTADAAGIGGSHPYLTEVTIPSYLGAVNPDDEDWVAGVLSLADTDVLRAAGSGDPEWVEGSSVSEEVGPKMSVSGAFRIGN